VISISDVEAIAAFADQIWVVIKTGVLRRFGLDGRMLDEHRLSIDPDAVLCPTAIGGPAALWAGRAPALLVDDLGRFVSSPLDTADAIPITGRRFAQYAGSRLILPSGLSTAMPDGARIRGGCVVLDGTALALIVEHPRGRNIVTIAVASGRTLQTMLLPPTVGAVRLATRRGLAIVQDTPRRLVILDLRFGRLHGSVATDDDVTDLAVDREGRLLALRLASGDVQLAPIGERRGAPVRMSTALSERPRPAVDETAVEVEGSRAGRVAAEPEDTGPATGDDGAAAPPRRSATVSPLSVEALEPRRAPNRLPRAQALAALDLEIQSVTQWTWCAIASNWDTRRLAYGHEGPHPFEHEVAGLVGHSSGFASDYVKVAHEALAAHEAVVAANPVHRSVATPIAELRDEFGLSPVAVDILLVIAAPSLRGTIARLYGVLGNDTGRALVDELLVQSILAGKVSGHDVTAELDARAPLVRFGIVGVQLARPRPFAALEVDPCVLSRLRGEQPDLGTALVERTADRALDEMALAPGVVMSAAAALSRAASPARVVVRGRAGTGRRTLLAACAAKANRALGLIDAAVLPRDAQRFASSLHLGLQRAQLAGLLPVVHGLEAVVIGDRTGPELAREVLAAHPGPLAVLARSDARLPLPPGHVVIDVPPLSETERLTVWEQALERSRVWVRDPAGLAARYRIGPGVIRRAVAAATGADPLAPCDDCIDAFLRQHRDHRLAEQARRVERLASWADLVLPPDVMDSLREFVARVRHRRTVFETWGMSSVMATSRGLTALFQGQPGTGKTLVAGVIARELGLDLYQVDLSKIVSKWIGETEKNLSTIFDAAEDGQAILLFDEADSLFAKRTEVRSSNDRYANLEVNYLLQRLDAFEGIAILTTNNGGSIDAAFKRRLSIQLSFPFPDEETREALWQVHLPPSVPRGERLEFKGLSRKFQLSGGYIRNACLRAVFLAAQEETTLHQHHLERAVNLEFAEVGKLSTTGTMA